MSRTDSPRQHLDRQILKPLRVTLEMLPNGRAERLIPPGNLWHRIFHQPLGHRRRSEFPCSEWRGRRWKRLRMIDSDQPALSRAVPPIDRDAYSLEKLEHVSLDRRGTG